MHREYVCSLEIGYHLIWRTGKTIQFRFAIQNEPPLVCSWRNWSHFQLLLHIKREASKILLNFWMVPSKVSLWDTERASHNNHNPKFCWMDWDFSGKNYFVSIINQYMENSKPCGLISWATASKMRTTLPQVQEFSIYGNQISLLTQQNGEHIIQLK